MTLQEIGNVFGICRERVRQITSWEFGIDKIEGGGAIKCFLGKREKAEKKAAHRSAREQRFFDKWRVTEEFAKSISDLKLSNWSHPIRLFERQRQNAKNRGVGWDMTFKQWWDIWQESGHWHERGRRADGYVMGRYGDSDGYTPDNVYICTLRQNSMDGYIAHPVSERIAKRRKTLEARA